MTFREVLQRGAAAGWEQLPCEPPKRYGPDAKLWWIDGWKAGKAERDYEDRPQEPDSARTVEFRNSH